MRLQEPLQGIKLVSQLDPIYHIALFSAYVLNQFIRSDGSAGQKFIEADQYTYADLQVRNVCYWLCIGHVVEVLVYFMAAKMKSCEMDNHAAVIRAASALGAYLVPIFYANYIYIKYKGINDRRDTVYANWMFQEILVFQFYIVSGVLCLLSAFIFKYRAPRRERRVRLKKDTWAMKDNDDFLNYMKMEFRQFSLHVPNMLREVEYIIRGYAAGGVQNPIAIQILFALPLAYRAFTCTLFFLQLSRGLTIQSTALRMVFWAVRIITIGAALVLFIFVSGQLRQTQISQMLVDILQCFILLPYDFVIQKHIDEELNLEKEKAGEGEGEQQDAEDAALDEKAAEEANAKDTAAMIEKMASASNLDADQPKQDLNLLGEAKKPDFASAATKSALLKALGGALNEKQNEANKRDALQGDAGDDAQPQDAEDILARAEAPTEAPDDLFGGGETNSGASKAAVADLQSHFLKMVKAGLPAKKDAKPDVADKVDIMNAQAKIFVTFDADVYSLSALCFWKDHVENFKISKQVLAQRVYMMLFIFLVQMTMLFCMTINLVRDSQEANGEFNWGPDEYWYVYFARFTCAVALHIKITPITRKGIKLFNFCNNQAEYFANELIPVACGLLQVLTSYLAAGLSVYMLCGRGTVEKCIIDFVALVIIVDITQLYYATMSGGSQGGLDFKQFISKPVIKHNMSSDLYMHQRSCCQKIFRIWYKLWRAVFVSVFFYFMPFAVIVLPLFALRYPFTRSFDSRDLMTKDREGARSGERCITGELPFSFGQFNEFDSDKPSMVALCNGGIRP